MDNETEQRANIKFCVKFGMDFDETHNKLKTAYGDDCLQEDTVRDWYARFKQGRKDIGDISTENMKEVLEILRSDCYVSVELIESLTGIPTTIINRILEKDLGKWKICERFVPRTLTKGQKDARVEHCEGMRRAFFESNSNFMNNIVTSGRIWIFQYEPLAEQQDASTSAGQSSEETKPERMQKSQIKILLTVFFDSRGMVHKEFIPEEQTMDAEYYLGILKRLWESISQVRPDYEEPRSWCLLHDEALAHKSIIICDFLVSKGITALEYPPHSPDLTPYDFWLFPKLKSMIKERRYNNIKDMENALTMTLEAIPPEQYKDCFEDLFNKRLDRCIMSGGEHPELEK